MKTNINFITIIEYLKGLKMESKSKIFRFLHFEKKLFLITIILILIISGLTWKTFFKNSTESEIRREYILENISSEFAIHPKRLKTYTDNELEIINNLDLNGLIALEQYREATSRLYEELKNYQLFYDVVAEFGPHHTIPVLDHFYDEGNFSLLVENKISKYMNSFFSDSTVTDTLSTRQKRLLMILNEIETQKHNFLARFIYTENGVERNYVSTTTSTIVNFFTGGLTNFNAAVVTKGVSNITTAEYIDAGIDVLVLIPFAAMFSRGSKTAARAIKGGVAVNTVEKAVIAESAGATLKTGRFVRFAKASGKALRAIPIRTLFKFKYVKWYALGLAIVKPSLINHAASIVAEAVSVPAVAMKTGFWFLIFFPILNLLFPFFLLIRSIWRKFIPKNQIA